MTPLALMLVGSKENPGLFASQSHLAREVSRSSRDYPDVNTVRTLIQQICAGKRKVPNKLKKVVLDLLNEKPDHLISAVRKEMGNHNDVIVPMMRNQKCRGSAQTRSEQNEFCRALVRNRILALCCEKSLEDAAAEFARECRQTDPEIGDGWQELFSDLLRDKVRELK